MTSTRRKVAARVLTIVLAATVMTGGGAGVAPAVTVTDPGGYYITTADGAASFAVADADAAVLRALGDVAGEATVVEPQAAAGLPPWPSCGFSDKNTKVLYQYKRQAISGYAGARATLACGSSAWGFRHITKHISQWQKKADLIGALWMDLAHWSITQTLTYPCSKFFQSANQTFQYIAPFQLKDRNGRVVHTFGVRVAVIKDTQNILTSYPQTATC